MRIVVNDANILIDLVKLNLLPNFFSLDFEFYTTDLILDELHLAQQEEFTPYIDNGTLQVMVISEVELEAIVTIQIEKPQLSEQDCSAFYQARDLEATLVTSDNNLRKFAQEKELDVHGHLWVFDKMVDREAITPLRASQKLDELCDVVNPRLRLPNSECQRRKLLWNN